MAQHWANFTVSGGGGCTCCGDVPTINCTYECFSLQEQFIPPSTNCGDVETVSGTDCSTEFTEAPCTGGNGSVFFHRYSNVRLIIDGLTANVNYTATVFFESNPSFLTSNTIWNFTATSANETTSNTSVPDANIDEYTWYVTGCNVVTA
jgi:hypothetical protein